MIDASVFKEVAALFVTLTSTVLLLQSCWSSVLISASASFGKSANESDCGVSSETNLTGQDGVGNITLTKMSMNDIRTSRGTMRFSTTQNWTHKGLDSRAGQRA